MDGSGVINADEVLKTRVCELFGIDYPIVQAGMGYLARVELVAAVSNAGALGVVGSTGNLTPGGLRDEIRGVRALTDRPFAVNLLFALAGNYNEEFRSDMQARVDAVLDEGVPILGAGLGVPPPEVIEQCRAAGTKVMCTVGAARHARKAVDAGVDVVVAQGWEAGGHNSRVASMALIPQVYREVGHEVPILAAGGMGSGSALVAAFALGASGGYFGTLFASSHEAQAHPHYKQAIVDAKGTDTVVSRALSGKPVRMLDNDWVKHFEAHPDEILPFPDQMMATRESAVAARVEGKVNDGAAPMGQVAGLVTASEPAAVIVERLISEARETLTSGLASR